MANINIKNIENSFAKTNSLFCELDNIPHDENVPLEYINPAPYNPYNEFDDADNKKIIFELADSICSNGLLDPLLLHKISDTNYRIISGERRYKAIKTLEWRTIPARVYENLDPLQEELKLHTANLEARSYTSSQKFKFYKRLVELLNEAKKQNKLSETVSQAVARMLKMSERQVRKYKRLSELPQEEQQAIENEEISLNEAYKEAMKKRSKEIKPTQEKDTLKPTEDITPEPTEDIIKNNNMIEIKVATLIKRLNKIKSCSIINEQDYKKIDILLEKFLEDTWKWK